MKKELLLLLFSLCFGALQAQILIIEDHDLSVSGPADEFEYSAYTDMVNQTADSLFLRWDRTSNDIPDGWEAFICALPAQCGLPGTNTLDFPVVGNGISEFQGHFRPHGIPGTGTMTVDIINNIDDSLIGTITVTLDATPVSINELEAAKIQLFPNPTENIFQLSNKAAVAQIEIYNILGRKVREYSIDDNEYFVGDLPKGMYLVRLYADDRSVNRTIKMQKI